MNPRRARRRQRTREHRTRSRVGTALDLAVGEALADMRTGLRRRLDVNYGWCEDVARSTHQHLARMGVPSVVLKDTEEFVTSDHEIYSDDVWTHAWIWVQGRHYDAEAREGVYDWLRLPHFLRWTQCPEDPAELVRVRTPGEENRMLERSLRWEREENLADPQDSEEWVGDHT